MADLISLTNAAADHIKQMIEKNSSNIGFRLSIKKTGCSGYSYVPSIIDKINEKDIHFIQHGIQIFIDPEAAGLLNQVVIDFVNDSIGLKQKRLVFINPNEKARCGCGESFTVE